MQMREQTNSSTKHGCDFSLLCKGIVKKEKGLKTCYSLLNHFPGVFQVIQVYQSVVLALVALRSQWTFHSPQHRLRVFVWILILHAEVRIL